MANASLTESYVARYQLAPGVTREKIFDTSLPGYAVIIGKRSRTFVVQHRVNGEQRYVVIGRQGEPGAGADKSERWTEARARRRAMEELGKMSAGIDPVADDPKRRPDGPTLRTALDFHLEGMRRGENRRGKVCSPRSIKTMEGDVTRHFADYLDRPLVDLDADAIDAVLRKVEAETVRRSDANPDNPPGRALRNRLLVEIGTIWRSWNKRYGLPVANPTERLSAAALKPRDTRIADDGFAAWYAHVMTMKNPIRRDLQLVGLFTGVRSEGLRTLTWTELDFDDDLIQIERAKGDKPYTIPMVATVRDILKKRRADNAERFAPLGGDHGFVFPSISRDRPFRVIPVAEPKERATALPGLHASRRTLNSVAIEIGIPLEAREALLNHAGRGVNVRHYGRPQSWDYLKECATKIEAALWQRICGTTEQRSKTKRR